MTPTPEQLAKLPKWAKEEFDLIKKQLALEKAFRWPTLPMPSPIIAKDFLPDNFGAIGIGWYSHTNEGRYTINQGCFTSCYHNAHGTDKTTSQSSGRFFHTKLDALIQARWEICNRTAETLARLDKEISESSAEQRAYVKQKSL